MKNLSKLEYHDAVLSGIIPQGVPRECPKCHVWARYEFPKKASKNACMEVECPSCGNAFEIAKGIK